MFDFSRKLLAFYRKDPIQLKVYKFYLTIDLISYMLVILVNVVSFCFSKNLFLIRQRNLMG